MHLYFCFSHALFCAGDHNHPRCKSYILPRQQYWALIMMGNEAKTRTIIFKAFRRHLQRAPLTSWGGCTSFSCIWPCYDRPPRFARPVYTDPIQYTDYGLMAKSINYLLIEAASAHPYVSQIQMRCGSQRSCPREKVQGFPI